MIDPVVNPRITKFTFSNTKHKYDIINPPIIEPKKIVSYIKIVPE